MKTKFCKFQNHELPISEFTSTRAKYCISCTRLRLVELQNKRQQGYIERLQNKKQKTKVVSGLRQIQKQLQTVFNAWIRKRDKDLPCISCGQFKDKYHAGHFIAQGFSGFLRFNEDNCHKQCVGCNLFKRGNLLEYRIALVKKIGEERVKWLEDHRHDVKKWTREELLELLERYK